MVQRDCAGWEIEYKQQFCLKSIVITKLRNFNDIASQWQLQKGLEVVNFGIYFELVPTNFADSRYSRLKAKLIIFSDQCDEL